MHLSDVHLRSDGATSAGEAPCRTAFKYVVTSEACRADADSGGEEGGEDAEGDLCVRRKRRRRRARSNGGHIVVRHALETRLRDVGLQVWRGALLLADFLLARPDLLRGAAVLDLGAGCGLTSVAAARAGARTVFCTDAHEPSLRNALQNAADNGAAESVRVRRLEWGARGRDAIRSVLIDSTRDGIRDGIQDAIRSVSIDSTDGAGDAADARVDETFCWRAAGNGR